MITHRIPDRTPYFLFSWSSLTSTLCCQGKKRCSSASRFIAARSGSLPSLVTVLAELSQC